MSDSTHKIILFSEPHFKGKALVVFGGINNLYESLIGWNDKAQSLIVVKGHWGLKAGPGDNSGEKPMLFHEGERRSFLDASEAGLNKGITSLLPIHSVPTV